jgi:hypothetical protein
MLFIAWARATRFGRKREAFAKHQIARLGARFADDIAKEVRLTTQAAADPADEVGG